jgi:hypothetical protein
MTETFTGSSGPAMTQKDLLAGERQAAREGPRRKRNVLILGILLLASYFTPVVMPTGPGGYKLEFIGITGLTMPQFPLAVRAFLLHPLVAGVATILLACLAGAYARGAALVVLGVIPATILLVSNEARAVLGELAAQPQAVAVLAVLAVHIVGLVGIHVGSRARWYRPDKRSAFGIGVAGGALLLLSLVLPCLGEEGGWVLLAAPLKLIGADDAGWMGIATLLYFCSLIAAAIVCFTNTHGRPYAERRVRAAWAFWLLVASWLCLGLGTVGQTIASFSENSIFDKSFVVVMLVNVARQLLAVIAAYLLIPFGLTDLVVGPAPAPLRPGALGVR